MDLLLFAVFFVVALAFFSLGKAFHAFWFVAGAGVLLLILGVVSINEGLYYQVVNQTNTSYSFSNDYWEYANDSVLCHNCTTFAFNETFDATPPGCCEHDVNTSINGVVYESRNSFFETRALEHDTSAVISLTFVLFGLGAFLDVGLQMMQRKKPSRGDD